MRCTKTIRNWELLVDKFSFHFSAIIKHGLSAEEPKEVEPHGSDSIGPVEANADYCVCMQLIADYCEHSLRMVFPFIKEIAMVVVLLEISICSRQARKKLLACKIITHVLPEPA